MLDKMFIFENVFQLITQKKIGHKTKLNKLFPFLDTSLLFTCQLWLALA